MSAVGGAGAQTTDPAPPVGAETSVHETLRSPTPIAVSAIGDPAGTVWSPGQVSVPPQPSSTAPLQLSSTPLLQTSVPGSASPAHAVAHIERPPATTHDCIPSRQAPTPRVPAAPE